MENNIKDFLDKIQELGDKKNTKVFVASLNKEISCQNLTFKQQKDIISTIGDGFIGVLKFQKILNDVVLENTDNQDLLVTDKLPIILKLRQESISDDVVITDGVVKISSLLNNVSKFNPPKTEVVKGEVILHLETPKISEENKILKYSIDNTKVEENNVSKSIGQIYTFEIVKYISKLVIGNEELEFDKIPVKDRYKVVENLPLEVNRKAIAFIQKIKSAENTLLTDDSGNSVDIDVSFFDTND
jgi:hypothetical protein